MKNGLSVGEERICTLVLDHFPDAVIVTDVRGRVEYASPSCKELLGFIPEKFEQYYDYIHPNDLASVRKIFFWTSKKKGTQTLYYRFRTRGQKWTVIELRVLPMVDEDGKVKRLLMTKRNFTDVKEREEELLEMALVDPLTRLPNRRSYEKKIEQVLTQAKLKRQQVAVLSIDCDNFKEVNDTYGHRVGDVFLQIIVGKISMNIRDTDMLFRWGGDEFVLLLPAVKSRENVCHVVERILQSFAETCTVDGYELNASVSIGIAIFPKDGTDKETLLHHADLAMYRAKQAGRSQYYFYAESM